MKYTARYFKNSLPDWKRRRDPFPVRFLYRPLSFLGASFCANHNISANTVSIISTFVGVVGCLCFLIPEYWSGIIGSILINIWLILDCVDGNLARTIKSQPYGEFVDAMSSYILVGLLFNILGLRAYWQGGVVFSNNVVIIFIGALASSFDSLMRLIYQKYIVISRELGIEGKVAADGSNANNIDKLRTRIDLTVGIGGILPVVILIACIVKCLDVVVVLWCIYYGCVFVATITYLTVKVIRMR